MNIGDVRITRSVFGGRPYHTIGTLVRSAEMLLGGACDEICRQWTHIASSQDVQLAEHLLALEKARQSILHVVQRSDDEKWDDKYAFDTPIGFSDYDPNGLEQARLASAYPENME